MIVFYYLILFGIACGIITRAVRKSQEAAIRREKIKKLRRENEQARVHDHSRRSD